jgi:hypothetical protein
MFIRGNVQVVRNVGEFRKAVFSRSTGETINLNCPEVFYIRDFIFDLCTDLELLCNSSDIDKDRLRAILCYSLNCRDIFLTNERFI